MRRYLTSVAPVLCAAALILLSACSKDNGERMVLIPVEDDPTITFRVMFHAGSQQDPEGKEGLAFITAQMLTDGATMNNPYDVILEKLYPMAAGYGSIVDKETTVIYGRTHTDNLKEYYALYTDAILKPAFKEEDFQRIKDNTLNYIENILRYSSDEELGKAALYNFVFQGTNYGHIEMGTVESLKNMTLEDVRNFYENYYTRDNFTIGLGGGYAEDLSLTLTNDLYTLPGGEIEPPAPPAPEPITGHEVLLVEKEADATAISFGFPIDIVRGDEDFFALALFNSWFGEHRNSSSHLYQVIREKRGLNYGDYSYIEIFPNGGSLQQPEPNHPRRVQLFEVWIRPVQNEHRHFALRAAMRELKHVIDSGMTKEDFELTQKFLDTYALNWANTTSKRVGYALDSRFYGIDDEYIDLFRKKISALTLEQVNNAVKKHLQYENIRIAMVTNGAEAFKQALVSEEPSLIVYSTPKPEEVMQEDKEIAVFPLNIKEEDVRIVPVDQMFAK